MNGKYGLLVFLGLMIPLSNLAFAQGTAARSDDIHELNKKLNDPTQPVKSFIFYDNVTVNYYGRSGTSNAIQFQPVIPFEFANHQNILRLTLPYNTGGVAGSGLAPIQIFNLTMFKLGGGQLGVGPVLNFNPNWQNIPDSGDRIQAGLSWAYIKPAGKWTFGVLQQNLLSPNVKITAIQPVIAYAFPKGWSANAGSQTWAFDWDAGGGLLGVPLGLSVGKIVTFPGKQMVKFAVNPEYNAKSIEGSSHWTIRAYAVLLVR